MKKTLLLLLISVISVIALAHEFWLYPQKFFYTVREVANIRFNVGENFTGENWGGNNDKIEQLLFYTPAGAIMDLSSGISANKGDSLQLPLQEEGTYMVIFNSTPSFINLEADKFNDYLREDGLDPVFLYRKRNREDQLNGKEYYQRSVKTIFQVGGKITDACNKPTSLPLDIIPEHNPYSLPVFTSKQGNGSVKFRVLFNGAPLRNTLVKIWHQTPQKQVKMDTLRTNKKGWVTAQRHPGPYMVSCVYMERNTKDTVADWQSYWGSVSFEYSQFFQQNRNK